MIATDVARLVGMAAEVDPRMPELDADGLRVWFGLLADVSFDVACTALAEHYRTTSDTITPSVFVQAQKTAARRARNAAALEELRRRPPAFNPAARQWQAALSTIDGVTAQVQQADDGTVSLHWGLPS
jgi:hypothetical protein